MTKHPLGVIAKKVPLFANISLDTPNGYGRMAYVDKVRETSRAIYWDAGRGAGDCSAFLKEDAMKKPLVESVSSASIREVKKWDGVGNCDDMVAAARLLAKRLVRLVWEAMRKASK